MVLYYLREPLTGQDRRRAAPMLRRWQQSLYERQDVGKWARTFASLEDVLRKTRPRKPVTIYRSVRDKSEVGDVVYDRFTSWTLDPDLGFKYVEGSPDVIARVHAEDIVMTVSAFGKLDHDQMSEVILRPGRYFTVLKPRSRYDHPTPPLSPLNTLPSSAGASAGTTGRVRRGRAAGARETWYHLTDRARFKLDPKHAPADAAIAIEDRSGRRGIYLSPDVERWISGYGYLRPFVVEFAVDPNVAKAPGVHGRYGGEMFVPASEFGKLEVVRVIPTDALAREQYGGYGWIEDRAGYEFDTGEPVDRRKHYKFRGYRYGGPDVRAMGPQMIAHFKKMVRAARPR